MAGAKERSGIERTEAEEFGRLSRTRKDMDVTRYNKKRHEKVPCVSRRMAVAIEKET